MQTNVDRIWSQVRKLPRTERLELIERLIHQLLEEETSSQQKRLVGIKFTVLEKAFGTQTLNHMSMT